MREIAAQAPADVLAQGLVAMDLNPPPPVRRRLLRLVDLLARWNRVYSLTAIRDPAAMVPRHILDSLAVLPFLHGRRVIDVGTGPGFPGLPLAVMDAERRFTLLDASPRKLRFCRQAMAELGLDNVTVVCARAEAHDPGEGFDTVVARAYGPLPRLVADAAHLMAAGGVFLAMKGPEHAREGVPDGDLAIVDVQPLQVPGLNAGRQLIRLARREDRA